MHFMILHGQYFSKLNFRNNKRIFILRTEDEGELLLHLKTCAHASISNAKFELNKDKLKYGHT